VTAEAEGKARHACSHSVVFGTRVVCTRFYVRARKRLYVRALKILSRLTRC